MKAKTPELKKPYYLLWLLLGKNQVSEEYFTEQIDKYVKQEALKARIDELQKWHSFDEPADEIANRISRLESQLTQKEKK